jgi:hypothetical protein
MKTAIVAIIFLLVGAAIGGFLVLGVGAGMGAGAGIVVGSQAGACLAVEAAKEQGLLTAEEVDQVLGGALGKIKGEAELPPDAPLQWITSEADCSKMIDELRKAGKSEQ